MASVVLHALAYPVTALGPGRRIALWVAGCSLSCAGCIAPALRDSATGRPVAADVLARRLIALQGRVDGLTLTGGEPFEQAGALSEVLTLLSAARPDWNVLAFSGYARCHLEREETTRGLLERVDILVDGPYVARRPPSHPLAASGNQKIHYLSARGAALRPMVDALPFNQANLGLREGQQHLLIGILDPQARARIHRALHLVAGDSHA